VCGERFEDIHSHTTRKYLEQLQCVSCKPAENCTGKTAQQAKNICTAGQTRHTSSGFGGPLQSVLPPPDVTGHPSASTLNPQPGNGMSPATGGLWDLGCCCLFQPRPGGNLRGSTPKLSTDSRPGTPVVNARLTPNPHSTPGTNRTVRLAHHVGHQAGLAESRLIDIQSLQDSKEERGEPQRGPSVTTRRHRHTDARLTSTLIPHLSSLNPHPTLPCCASSLFCKCANVIEISHAGRRGIFPVLVCPMGLCHFCLLACLCALQDAHTSRGGRKGRLSENPHP